jgi:predicted naringenin-chalcone synthase
VNIVMQALATANPPRYATQKEIYEYIVAHFSLKPREKQLYEKILLEGPIKGRYFGIDYDEQMCEMTPDALIERFLKHGKKIAVEAARKAMQSASVKPADIGGIVVNTCTGYLCPGLSSYIAQDLKLKNSIKVFDLMGMGCGAAIPNLDCAASMASRRADGPILSIAVEICSATFFMGPSPDLVISNSIFGDGAAAAIVDTTRNGQARRLLRLIDFESAVFPRYRDQLRYKAQEGRLRNTLSMQVPAIGARTIRQVSQNLLARHKLEARHIDHWVVHPGGTMVLDEVVQKLGISQQALKSSYEIFENYGNMSSPSVLFVLKKILDESEPKRGQKGMLLSFGAGFTAFAALVEF